MTLGNDVDLLRAWRAGDEAAGNALVERHFATTSRFFRRKVDTGVADLLQKTFLGCVESRDRVPDGLPFKVYLLGIARRVLSQHFREEHRRREEAGVKTSHLVEPAPGASGKIAAKEEQRLLLAGLRELPLDLQLAIELFYWEQLTTDEIGHVLEIPRGTVKSRLGRAKRQLRTAVETLASSEHVRHSTVRDLDKWARSLRRYMERTSDEPGSRD